MRGCYQTSNISRLLLLLFFVFLSFFVILLLLFFLSFFPAFSHSLFYSFFLPLFSLCRVLSHHWLLSDFSTKKMFSPVSSALKPQFTAVKCLSQGARGTYRAPPSPPPPSQEPSTMVPKCTLGCPEHNLTCSPESHWDALEL